ncbi:amidohydrolase family protein, partial [Pseudomonas donghuensis]
MIDRVFVNAVAADGSPLNLAVADGRIVSLGSERPASAGAEVIDLAGHLVLPGLVDGHIHLDKSFVGDRWHPHQPAASLRERLAIEKRELASAPPMLERAEALIRQAVSFGTVAMRSHVDVDATTGLRNLQAVLEAREKWRGIVDIELVAFPQAGVMSCPGTAEVLDAAIREGADVIGGIDPTTLDGDADGQLDVVFGIAERHAVKIDIHLHEPGLQGIEQLQRIAARTRAAGLNGRVAVSHAYALGQVDDEVVARTAATLAEAGVA